MPGIMADDWKLTGLTDAVGGILGTKIKLRNSLCLLCMSLSLFWSLVYSSNGTFCLKKKKKSVSALYWKTVRFIEYNF